MNTCKYIAEGFMNDATKLFNDFAKLQDLDFKAFCKVWKEHKFVYIFMGRPDTKDFREFTNEIYQLVLDYMMASSTESKIAAIYLLYALYRNQNVVPSIRIRVVQSQYKVLQQIHRYAMEKKIRTLHFIMDYLMKNCLELVFNGSLYGPCSSKSNDSLMKQKNDHIEILSDLKQDITLFHESNVLQNLRKIRNQYNKQVDNVILPTTSRCIVMSPSDINKCYEKFDNDIEVMAYGRRRTVGRNKDDNIGSRRAQLKKNSFKKRALFRYLNEEDEAVEEADNDKMISIIKKRQYKKRPPVNQRRVGRPRKRNPSDDDSEPDKQPEPAIVTKGKRGPIGRRKVSYLKNYEGPTILETPKQKEPVVDDSSDNTSNNSFDVDDLVF